MGKLLVAVAVVIVIILIYIPVLNGFKDAFLTDKNTPTTMYLGEEFSRSVIQRSIKITLAQATLSTIISVILGSLAAYALAFTRLRGENIIQTLYLLAFMAPVMIVVTGFTTLYGPEGILSKTIPQLTILGRGFWGIIAAHVFYNTPLATLYIYSSLTGIPRETLQSIIIYAKGKTRLILRRIIIPYTLNPAIAASIIIFAYCFTSFAIPLTIGGIRYSTLEVYIYRYYRISLNPHAAAAVAFIQYIPLQILTIILIAMLAKTRTRPPPIGGFRYQLPMPRTINLLLKTIVYLETIYILLPLIIVPYYSLINPYTGKLSLEAYTRILTPSYDPGFGASMMTIYVNTAYYAFMALIIGLTITYILASLTPSLTDTVILSLLAISPLTLSLGLLRTYSTTTPIPFIIILAHTIAALPLTIRLLRIGIQRVNKQYVQAAETLGVKGLKMLFRVKLPLLKPSLLSAALLVLVTSLGEFSATYFIATAQYSTLSVAIQLFRGLRKWQEASAAATLLLIITGGLTLIANKRGVKWRM